MDLEVTTEATFMQDKVGEHLSFFIQDPNGYMVELTRALRPVTPQEDLDANLTIDALLDVLAHPDPTLAKLYSRKAELIVQRAGDWVPVEAGQQA